MRTAKNRFTALLVGFFFAFNSCTTTETRHLRTLEVILENQATAIRPLIKIVETPSKTNPLLKLALSKEVKGPVFRIQVEEEKKTTEECDYEFGRQLTNVALHGLTFGVFLVLSPVFGGGEKNVSWTRRM